MLRRLRHLASSSMKSVIRRSPNPTDARLDGLASRLDHLADEIRDLPEGLTKHADVLGKDAWAASQMRQEHLLNHIDELHRGAWDVAQLRHEYLSRRIDELHHGAWDAAELRQQNLIARIDELHQGSWDVGVQRHDSVSSRLSGLEVRLAEAHGALEELRAGAERLRLQVVDNHSVTWDSSRILSSTTLERFASLERAVRELLNDSSPSRSLGDPAELVAEVQRVVRLRTGDVADNVGSNTVDVFGAPISLPADDTVMLPYIREHGVWEPHVARALTEHCAPGDVVLDIGAHVGIFSCLMSEVVGPQGTVIAVEPDRRNAHLLRGNLLGRGLANVVLVEAAVSAERGILPIFRSPFANSGDIRIGSFPESGEEDHVLAVTLDDLVPETVSVTLIKIDVQGLDFAVLSSGQNLLARDHPTLVIEVTPDLLRERGDDPDAFIAWLEDLGYEVSVLERIDGEKSVASAGVVAAAEASPIGYVDVICRYRRLEEHGNSRTE